jgi:hypothetical protein
VKRVLIAGAVHPPENWGQEMPGGAATKARRVEVSGDEMRTASADLGERALDLPQSCTLERVIQMGYECGQPGCRASYHTSAEQGALFRRRDARQEHIPHAIERITAEQSIPLRTVPIRAIVYPAAWPKDGRHTQASRKLGEIVAGMALGGDRVNDLVESHDVCM